MTLQECELVEQLKRLAYHATELIQDPVARDTLIEAIGYVDEALVEEHQKHSVICQTKSPGVYAYVNRYGVHEFVGPYETAEIASKAWIERFGSIDMKFLNVSKATPKPKRQKRPRHEPT